MFSLAIQVDWKAFMLFFSAYINCHLFVYFCRMKGLISQLVLSFFQSFIKVLHLGVKGHLFHH